MKSVCVCVFLLLGAVSAQAQAGPAAPLPETGATARDLDATSPEKVTLPDLLAAADPFAQPSANLASSAGDLGTTLVEDPRAAEPAAPSPHPRFVYGGRDDYRWQLGLALAWFRFGSSVFSSNEFGVKTTVSYFLNEWLGVEGSVTGAFGGAVGGGHDAKIAVYGGGPKIAWRQRRWEPWLHAIFGGAHEGPQTAVTGRNSSSLQGGGGADYRWNPHLSFRMEGDYVRTGFFHQTQSDFQFAGGVVIHF